MTIKEAYERLLKTTDGYMWFDMSENLNPMSILNSSMIFKWGPEITFGVTPEPEVIVGSFYPTTDLEVPKT